MDLFQNVRLNEEREFFSNIDKVDINIVSQSGGNLLHTAVASKNVKLALELIKRGINVNHPDSQGQTPLHHAATFQLKELVEAILKAGGKTSVRDIHGNTPLWAAVVKPKRDYEIVKLLVEHGGDPGTKNKAGKSPLDFARQINSEALIAMLEGRKASTTS